MSVKERWKKAKEISLSTDEALDLLISLFEKDKRIVILYLFGSRAFHADSQSSDIDLAFYTAHDFFWNDYFRLYGDITKKLCSDRVNLIWLNKAEPILRFQVIKEGKVLFFYHEKILHEFEQKTRNSYYDYCLYMNKHRRFREMVYRKESLLKRLEKLREYRTNLKEMEDIRFNEYMREKWTRYGVERLLFLMCTGILDFLDHILSSRYEIMSDSYENILESAYKRNIIGESLYFKLQGIGGFRNVLADEYLTLSDNEVFSNFLKMVEIIDKVIEDLENSIKNRHYRK